MYISDLTQKIRDFRDSQNPMSSEIYNFLDYIIDHIEVIGKTSIQWSVEDFLGSAISAENIQMRDPNIDFNDINMNNAKDYLVTYDPNKFKDALHNMISHHDAEIGITWDAIDYYLNEDCLITK